MFDDLIALAGTDINIAGMLALFMVLAAFGFIVWTLKNPSGKDETSENDVLRLLIEQFGSISTELRGFAAAVKTDSAESTMEHGEIVSTLKIMNTLLLTVSKSNNEMIESVNTLDKTTSRAENVMNSTVDEQAKDIKAILEAINRLEAKVTTIATNFDVLGSEIRSTKSELDIIKVDVLNLKPTKEAQKAKPAGVPVTPKPTQDKESKPK